MNIVDELNNEFSMHIPEHTRSHFGGVIHPQ